TASTAGGAQATVNLASAAGLGAAGAVNGNVTLTGNALLQFASGQIDTITNGAGLTLDGAQARVADTGALGSNSALAGLASNQGALALLDGASVSTSGALDNQGALI